MPLRAAGIGWISAAPAATLTLFHLCFCLSLSIPPHPISDEPAGQLCSSPLLSPLQFAPWVMHVLFDYPDSHTAFLRHRR